MLEIVSLFLGLTWGPQTIELVVADPQIVQVEIRLDGEKRARLEGEPWRATVDLGQLAPHRLEAIGLSQQGLPIARAEQWINVPRPQAEARLVVDTKSEPGKVFGVLKWESVSGKAPVHLGLRYDGIPIEVERPERFELPATGLEQGHFLTAELIFPDGATAHAEVGFGGFFGDQIETELTAIPVRVVGKKADLEQLYECFSDPSRRLRVAQVERGAAEVLFVRDRGAEEVLARLRQEANQRRVPTEGGRTRQFYDPEYRRQELRLEPEDRVRFLWPNAVQANHPTYPNAAIFESSPFLKAKDGGIFFFLTSLYPDPDKTGGSQHLADALALAGLRASSGGRRRAAVLVVGGARPEDHSTQTPAAVRAFLDTMAVPLHVWSGAEPKAPPKGWPAAAPIGRFKQVQRAFRELERDLDSQRIVWLVGRHLAAQVRLDARRCPDFELLKPH